jgi:hypothetical protein
MESPFAKSNTIVFYLEPILNTYYKSYQNIITLNTMPPGPLANLVSYMSAPKLSAYQQFGVFSSPTAAPGNCVHVLLRYPKNGVNQRPSFKNVDYFMTAEDIPSVLSYLVENGYTIESDLSKILHRSNIGFGGVSQSRLSGNRKMICIASYRHNNA